MSYSEHCKYVCVSGVYVVCVCVVSQVCQDNEQQQHIYNKLTSVSEHRTKETSFISSKRAILISIMANLIPTQLRGPAPNGM